VKQPQKEENETKEISFQFVFIEKQIPLKYEKRKNQHQHYFAKKTTEIINNNFDEKVYKNVKFFAEFS